VNISLEIATRGPQGYGTAVSLAFGGTLQRLQLGELPFGEALSASRLRTHAIAIVAALGVLGAPGVASAQTEAEPPPAEAPPAPPPPTRLEAPLPPPPPPEDDLPIPTLTIDRVPPNTSFEGAVQVSFGEVAYFTDAVPPWVGFGLRGGWGKNFGLHRIGAGMGVAAEGDIGIHTLLAFEPSVNWDFVSASGLLIGAGVGPSFMYAVENATVFEEKTFGVVPAGSLRIGWSQTWSRVGRRLFVFLEPKVRYTEGELVPLVALVVGSGAGR